jgi:hypothetical protein
MPGFASGVGQTTSGSGSRVCIGKRSQRMLRTTHGQQGKEAELAREKLATS